MRTQFIELKLMIAELELDGLKTHTTTRREKCIIYNTNFDRKVRSALSAVRAARDVLRNDSGSKQWSLTTRSKQANRHGLWDYNIHHPTWQCDFCKN